MPSYYLAGNMDERVCTGNNHTALVPFWWENTVGSPYVPIHRDDFPEAETLHTKFSSDAQRIVHNSSAPSLVMYGDSITFYFEKTQVFQEYFGTHSFAFGIRGDMTQHLLWRLQNGECPSKNKRFAPKVAAVMIGTNNLAYR